MTGMPSPAAPAGAPPATAPSRAARLAAFASGVLAAAAGMAVGHLSAGFVDPAASPVLAIGSTVIDATPTPVKEWAVSQFGTADKPILIGSVMVGAAGLAGVAGLVARRRMWLGTAIIVVLVGLAGAAAVGRPAAGSVAFVPALLALLVGVLVLRALVGSAFVGSALVRQGANGPGQGPERPPGQGGPTMIGPSAEPTRDRSRRRFLLGAAAVGAGAAAAGALGQRLAGPSVAAAKVRLPTPAEPARPLPSGLERSIAGISPLRTPNGDFYRIDVNLVVPRVSVDDWRLDIDGDVRQPFALTFPELLAMPMVERDITLNCVSNEVGGPYIGSTRWLGVRVKDLIERAGVRGSPDQVLSTATDGFTISTPLAALLDDRDALVAVAMDGEPLPANHGFPARLLTPGLYGYVGATKWLRRLTLTTYAAQQAYWTERGWAEQGPVKISSRIDTPRPLAPLKAGRVAIGGVAWAQQRGIRGVEVRIDGGAWQAATLGPDVGIDYWRQWYLPWDATQGRHALAVRATGLDGEVQTSRRAAPFPDGSSGIQEIVVLVR